MTLTASEYKALLKTAEKLDKTIVDKLAADLADKAFRFLDRKTKIGYMQRQKITDAIETMLKKELGKISY